MGRRCPVWDRGTPLPPLSIYFIFSAFYFFLSFLSSTYFLLLSIPSLSTRIVSLRFQAGGRRRRPNLGMFFLFNLCCLYSLVKMDCGVLFYLVLVFTSVLWHCWLGHLTRKNPSPIWPIMCWWDVKPYSINQSVTGRRCLPPVIWTLLLISRTDHLFNKFSLGLPGAPLCVATLSLFTYAYFTNTK